MNSNSKFSKSLLLCILLLFFSTSLSLNLDGTLLLAFKYSIISDPLSVLDNWDYTDSTPCSWTGIKCAAVENTPNNRMFDNLRVVSLNLPNSKLLGFLPEDLGFITHLQTLDLSDNFLNGPLPQSLVNASELQVLSLSNNAITGHIIPIKIESLRIFDLSSNSLTGPLPPELGGSNLRFLNLSSNKLSGSIPREFARKIQENATIDLSFNDLSGEIPNLAPFSNQKIESFQGNVNLCGKPLKKLCVIPSNISTNPPNFETSNNTSSSSSPAIAVMPKPINNSTNPSQDSSSTRNNRISSRHGLKPSAIAGITIVPLAGIGIFAMIIFLYIHHKRKRANRTFSTYEFKKDTNPPSSSVLVKEKEPKHLILNLNLPTLSCLSAKNEDRDKCGVVIKTLVMVDNGETELDPDTLFRASAYVLGSSGPSIVYKAVLRDGTSFAVRRIGDVACGGGMKEFERRVRVVAKMHHPNLVRVRGFYWGDDEKLVICDYVSNGSLANVGYRKFGSSPYHLPFETRLKIARGVARGLTYIHDKKKVHGNIKPSNILLTPDMEPVISDFGLDWLVHGPARHVNNVGPTSLYRAPESLDNPKPSAKWDVYSLGILSLEMLTGKVLLGPELSQWATGGPMAEEPNRVLRMADVAIRGDVARREETVLAWFKLGFSCASLAPKKRPSMRHALHVQVRPNKSLRLSSSMRGSSSSRFIGLMRSLKGF
ncbi:leucine-rich repeat protein kinase family protein [Striga asiatica]|uniref:Leucine-rich repeat protein kinase family protein n=1 Tax=Striga asiatica TaxID=4170 RepID=A0A5A7PVU9_STRAF|nr:leucine-rich repeat protein kinase family protein [Striga asiatica]